jgi:hypothetical protein
MSDKNQRVPSDHPSHPVRNFFYFLFSILACAAFCLLFLCLERGETVYAIASGAFVLLSFLVGVVSAMRKRKK